MLPMKGLGSKCPISCILSLSCIFDCTTYPGNIRKTVQKRFSSGLYIVDIERSVCVATSASLRGLGAFTSYLHDTLVA